MSYLLADFSGDALEDGPEAALNGAAAVPRAPNLLACAVAHLHALPNGRSDVRHNPLVRRQALRRHARIILSFFRGTGTEVLVPAIQRDHQHTTETACLPDRRGDVCHNPLVGSEALQQPYMPLTSLARDVSA